MIKILHVLTGPRAEGTPRIVLDWLTVKEYQHELLFLVSEGELKDEFLATGCWQKYNDKFQLSFRSAGSIINLVSEVCKDRKPDVVISWSMGFSQWIHWGAYRAGVRHLIAHAGNPPGKTFIGKYIFTYITAWTGGLFGAKIIACSRYIFDEYMQIPLLSQKQFAYTYNCFNPAKFSPLNVARDSSQAIMVATLEHHKDHETLLNAWKIIQERGLPHKLLIAGDGSLKQTLEAMIGDMNLHSVTMLGSRTDIPQLLAQSKVFVLSTTKQEGFGTVLIEALASGCRIVASDVPACREVLQGGKYGTLVSAANALHLADAIEDSFNRITTTSELESWKIYSHQFTPANMIRQYLSITGVKEN